MVISTSLALGLIFGFAIVQTYTYIYGKVSESCLNADEEQIAIRKERQTMMAGMYTAPNDDPQQMSTQGLRDIEE